MNDEFILVNNGEHIQLGMRSTAAPGVFVAIATFETGIPVGVIDSVRHVLTTSYGKILDPTSEQFSAYNEEWNPFDGILAKNMEALKKNEEDGVPNTGMYV